AGREGVWVAGCKADAVSRIDPRFSTLAGSTRVTGTPGGFGEERVQVAVGAGTAWASGPPTKLVRISPTTVRPSKILTPDTGTGPLAVGEGDVWTGQGNALGAIDDRTGLLVGTVRLPGSLTLVAVGAGAVWAVTNQPALVKIDPNALAVTASLPLAS